MHLEHSQSQPDLFGHITIAPAVYPEAPGFKAAGTSQEAAKAIAPTVKGGRKKVLDFLRGLGEPLTADQIATRLELSPFYVRPRLSELRAMDLVKAAPDRGRNESGMSANRWVAA